MTEEKKGAKEKVSEGIKQGIGVLSAFKDALEETIQEAAPVGRRRRQYDGRCRRILHVGNQVSVLFVSGDRSSVRPPARAAGSGTDRAVCLILMDFSRKVSLTGGRSLLIMRGP